VPLDVVRGGPEETRLVAEEAESVVAPLAQQLTNAARRVVMVEVLRRRVAANRAAVALLLPELI
jgi:hypothetical protein